MNKEFDTILYIEPEPQNILEYDSRTIATKDVDPTDKSFTGNPFYDDPKLYASFSFGNQIQRSLSNMGEGSFAKVADFGKWVTVEAGYSNVVSGRSDSKTFLIVFQNKGNGIILNTANKYRSISGVDQAINYIKSVCNSLKSAANNKI